MLEIEHVLVKRENSENVKIEDVALGEPIDSHVKMICRKVSKMQAAAGSEFEDSISWFSEVSKHY